VRLASVLILLALALPAVVLALPGDRRTAPDRPAAVPPSAATPPPRAAKPAPLPPVRTVEPAPLPPVRKAKPRPRSRAAGLPYAGRLVNGRQLPVNGPGYLTWDPIRKQIPNRGWRRWGTGRLLGTVQRVLAAYERRHPAAPPVLVGDLSRPRGGDFGPRYGGIGHASHQNGLDADIYYPRLDGKLRSPRRPDQVDQRAAQELVDAFVAEGAERVFVGPSLSLTGPSRVVQRLVNHDNHLHVRLPR
jgi:penicillin-insensitive murein endopeptidase